MAVDEQLRARVGMDLAGFEQGMAKMGRMTRQATSNVARWAKRATIAVAGLGTAAAIVGSKFEFELMKTVTVAQAFGKDLDALKEKARELGSTTAFTVTQAATGMYDLASAGMNTREILDATEHSMKLAGATGSEMAQATHLVAASLKQFNLDARESKRVVDTFAQAITSSLFTMEKLTEAMKYAGTAGSGLGWSLEETTAAVAQFIDLGHEGSMAGNRLRMAMLTLVANTPKATKALKEMGLTFEDINPETHTFGELLTTLGEKSVTTKQALALFGRRAALDMKKLAELAKTGTTDFDGFVKKLVEAQKGTGRAASMYQRMMDTFRGQWKILISALQDLAIEVFYIFEGTGKRVFNTITNIVNAVKEWGRQSGVFDSIKKALTGIEEPLKNIASHVKDWLNVNADLIRQNVVDTLDKIKSAFSGIWNILAKEPEIIEYGLVGLLVWGRKGAMVGALLGKFKALLEESLKFASTEGQAHLQNIIHAQNELAILRDQLELNKKLQDAQMKGSAMWKVYEERIKATNEAIQKQEAIIKTNTLSINAMNAEYDRRRKGGPPKEDPTKELELLKKNYQDYARLRIAEANRIANEELDLGKETNSELLTAREEFNEKLYQLTHDRYEYQRYMAKKEYDDFVAAGIKKVEAQKLLNARLAEISREQEEYEKRKWGLPYADLADTERMLLESREMLAQVSFARLEARKDMELLASKNHFDQLEQALRSHNATQMELDEVAFARHRAIQKIQQSYDLQVAKTRVDTAKSMVSGVTSILDTLYTSGLVQNKKMFRVLKAFKMAEAGIQGASAVLNALASPYPWPIPAIMAVIAGTLAAVQIAAIAAQQPPAMAYGGVVKGSGDGRGQIIRAGEYGDEAVVPMRDGGIPVKWMGEKGATQQQTVVENHYHFERAVFMDQNTLRRTLSSVAVSAVREDYNNDGPIRKLVRGGG